MRTFLGIDIGGTETKYGLYTEEGIQLESYAVQTEKETCDGFVRMLEEIIRSFPQVDGIGVSVPGFVNVKTGEIIDGGAIKVISNENIRELLQHATTVPMAFENDANCVALAEKWLGNGQMYENFLTVTIGTGIGGGIILNNQLYRGKHYMAGEFGYMFVHGLGPVRDRDYEWSQLGSTRGFVERVEEALQLEKGSINGRFVFAELEKGNTTIQKLYEEWIDFIASGVYNLNYCFNPEAILIGGGVSVKSYIIEDVKKRLIKMNAPILETLHIEPCHFQNDSGKIGAVYHLLQQLDMSVSM